MRDYLFLYLALGILCLTLMNCGTDNKAVAQATEPVLTLTVNDSVFQVGDTILITWTISNPTNDTIVISKLWYLGLEDSCNYIIYRPQGKVYGDTICNVTVSVLDTIDYVYLAPDSSFTSIPDYINFTHPYCPGFDLTLPGNYSIYMNYNTQFWDRIWRGALSDFGCWIGSLNSDTLSISIVE